METFEEHITFDCSGALMEGVLAYPEQGSPQAAVLLLAPHPQMGGNLDNNVVRHIARRTAEEGAVSLRFNYRGVGKSVLPLDPGDTVYAHFQRMEEKLDYALVLPDALAARAALYRIAPDAKMLYVGYSFGAILAGMLSLIEPPTAIAAISPPVRRVPLAPYRTCVVPKHFVHGDDDFAFEEHEFQKQYAALPEPKTCAYLEGSDHFFRKEEERVYEAVRAHLIAYIQGATP